MWFEKKLFTAILLALICLSCSGPPVPGVKLSRPRFCWPARLTGHPEGKLSTSLVSNWQCCSKSVMSFFYTTKPSSES